MSYESTARPVQESQGCRRWTAGTRASNGITFSPTANHEIAAGAKTQSREGTVSSMAVDEETISKKKREGIPILQTCRSKIPTLQVCG